MSTLREKRMQQRLNCEVPIVCSPFNQKKHCGAKALNFSPDGIYFEATTVFLPGENIYIKIGEILSGPGGSAFIQNFRLSALGEVRWCRRKSKTGDSTYGVGVKYHIPV